MRIRIIHLHAFGCQDAVNLAAPVRIQGGFDAAMPPPLVVPLTQRLGRAHADSLETVVQNSLSDMDFPAPA